MSLIKCKECWNDVSDKAIICPHCGAKIKEDNEHKKSCLFTIFTIVTTILSVWIAARSFVISEQSFNVAEQALKVSQIALKSTSSTSEPILNIDVDYDNDIITIKHETHDIYKIRYVYFGKIETYAIMTNDETKISSVEVSGEYTGQGLESANPESVNCTEEEAKKLNKEMRLDLYEGQKPENTTQVDELKEKIDKKIDKKKFHYWEVSNCFNYRYIKIYYYDVYGNTRCMYYIYKFEYGFKEWRIEKLSKKQFTKYTKNIIDNLDDKEIIKKLFSESNFEKFEKTKYYNFHDPFSQYYKEG